MTSGDVTPTFRLLKQELRRTREGAWHVRVVARINGIVYQERGRGRELDQVREEVMARLEARR